MHGKLKLAAVLSFALAAVAMTGWVGTASADIKVFHSPSFTCVKFCYGFPTPQTCESYFNLGGGNFCSPILVRAGAGGSHVLASACVTSGVVSSYCFCVGNTRAGDAHRPGISAISDSSYVQDSVRVLVARSATADTLKFQGTVLQNNKVGRGKIFVAVYPDSNVAKADVNNDGTGASLFGIAILDSKGTLTTAGALSPAQFIVTTNADGSKKAVPVANLTLVATGVNGLNNIVAVAADPASGDPGAPGASRPGIALLALLLGASGWWYLGARRKAINAS